MKQYRQTEIRYLPETDEYQVKLFINGKHQTHRDYFTNSFAEAAREIEKMEQQPKPQEDFCKAEEKKEKSLITPNQEDTYIYSESGEFIGSVYLDKDSPMPEKLELDGWMYERQAKARIILKEE